MLYKTFTTALILFLTAGFACLFGQEYLLQYQHYGIEEGLSHRNVQCVHQDPQGFLWLGTKYGLNRFDGYQFKWFTREKDSLQSNEINHILEDGTGRLWLFDTGVFGRKKVNHIGLFDPGTEQAQSLQDAFGPQTPFSSLDVISFNQNEKKELVFLTTDKRLVFYDGQFRSVFVHLPPYQRVFDLHLSPTGWTWVTLLLTSTEPTIQILAFDQQGRRVCRIEPEGSWNYARIYELDDHNRCRFIITRYQADYHFYQVDRDGRLQDDPEAARTFEGKGIDYRVFTDASSLEQGAGKYWISCLDESSDAFIAWDTRTGWQYKLSETLSDLKLTTDLYFDQRGRAWVTTQFGLYQIEFQPSHFARIDQRGGDSLNQIRDLEMDAKGRLWIVKDSRNGLWRADFPKRDYSKAAVTALHKTEGRSLPFDNIHYALLKTRGGELVWTPTNNSALKMDPATLAFTRIGFLPPGEKKGKIWSLYEDDEGDLWFATNEGWIGQFRDGPATLLRRLDNSRQLFHIYQFLGTRDGQTWIATEGGLFTLDTGAGRITGHYWSGGTDRYYLPFDNVYHVHEDEDGSLWLATAGTGLVHWQPTTGDYRQFTQADGLSSNTLYAVYEDEYGYLWLPSDYGIIRFDKNSRRTTTYLEKDGITHNEFNRISHYQHTDGMLFFGSLNGVTAFHPRDFQDDSSGLQAPLVITDYRQLSGQQQQLLDKTRELRNTYTITLAPDDPFFRLEFALLTYDDVEKVQYAYRIDDLGGDWLYQKENYLPLGRLPYGNYLLRVKGQNSQGQWSQQELAIRIEVLRPFYLKFWFLMLAVLGILFGAFAAYQWRVRSLKAQQAVLEQIVKERTKKISEDKQIIEQQAAELQSLERLKSRFFANVSHELRTPLTLMLGPVSSLLKRKDQDNKDRRLLQFVQRNGRQLQKLINEILDLSKLEEGKLQVVEEPVQLYTYLEDQLAQFYSFASSNKLHFQLDFQADPSLTILLDRNKFEKILHNFLSNAMKFTPPEGTIILSIIDREARLRVNVRDTGKGVHPDDLPYIFDRFYQSRQPDAPNEGGTGIGLSICKELAELLGGEVGVESKLGQGSLFYFDFPKKGAAPSSMAGTGGPASVQDTSRSTGGAMMALEDRPATAPDTRPAAGTGETTILVVEDNADLLEYLELLLSDYRVLTVGNGQAALDLLQTQDCQLIISDLIMPVMDGFALLEALKSDDRFRHLPVIMLTAKSNIRAKLRALRIGVDDYLTKPFQEEELKTRIANLLRNYRERMRFFRGETETAASPIAATPDRPVIAEVDAKWLAKVEQVLADNLADTSLKVSWIATDLNLSQRQFTRRLKQITGLTPNQYLQEMRLQQAREYLLEGAFATVKEVGYAVGFRDARYFSRLFQEQFGMNPSEIRGGEPDRK